jgi:hypothetical protein
MQKKMDREAVGELSMKKQALSGCQFLRAAAAYGATSAADLISPVLMQVDSPSSSPIIMSSGSGDAPKTK